jgi:hypothetical protein
VVGVVARLVRSSRKGNNLEKVELALAIHLLSAIEVPNGSRAARGRFSPTSLTSSKRNYCSAPGFVVFLLLFPLFFLPSASSLLLLDRRKRSSTFLSSPDLGAAPK